MTSMSDTFEFKGITFPKDGSVLDRLDISLGILESVALFGPNGGGKSSVLRTIAGTTPRSLPLGEISYLPQTPYLFRGTVAWNLLLGLDVEESVEANQLAEEFGVTHLLASPCDEISVGETQRISLARTLASKAPLVLLDEPLSPINAASRADIGSIIKRETADRALLWATHSLREVRALADRLIVLDEGVVLQEGTVENVLSSPVDALVESILGSQ